VDDAVESLSHVQRRILLVALLDESARAESTVSVADGSTDDSRPRLVEMDTVHLPKLAENGFIEWDRETNEVWRGPHYEDIRPVLTLIAERDEELP
jgi:hypothetical protein